MCLYSLPNLDYLYITADFFGWDILAKVSETYKQLKELHISISYDNCAYGEVTNIIGTLKVLRFLVTNCDSRLVDTHYAMNSSNVNGDMCEVTLQFGE